MKEKESQDENNYNDEKEEDKESLLSETSSENNLPNIKGYEMLLFETIEDTQDTLDAESTESEININKVISIYKMKDHLMMIFLLLSSSLNFSALYMPNIILGISYIYLTLKYNNNLIKYIKMKIEIISLIYSIILIIAKIVFIIIIKKGHTDYYESHIDLYSNLGIRYMEGKDWDFKIMLNLFGEIFLIIISLIAIFINRCYKTIDFEFNDIKSLTEIEFKSKINILIYLGYFSILINSIYNKSFLTLAYLMLYHIILILLSLKIISFNFIRHVTIVYLIFLSIHLILINIFNIHSLQKKYLEVNIIKKDNENIEKVYSILTQIGFNYSYYYSIIPFLYELFSYLACILTIVIFTCIQRTFIELNQDNKNIKKNELNNEPNETEKETKEASRCNKIKSALKKFFQNMELLWLVFRILSLLWMLQLKNFFALVIFIFIFFSFIFNSPRFIFNLIIFLLIPINLITIGCLHISNINGISENLSEGKKRLYKDFAFVKDDSNLHYILVGIYSIFIIIFLNIYNSMKLKIKIPKENIILIKSDDKIKEINDENEEPLIDGDKDNNNKIKEENNIDKKEEQKKKGKNNDELKDLNLFNVLLKLFFNNIDKITLIAMYFISMHTINIIHFFFIIIFFIQILVPDVTKKYSKLILILIQILFLFEYIVAITNNYYEQFFIENYKLFEFLLSVSKNGENYEINIYIEVWCYAAVYVFYLQDKLLTSEKYNELKKDKNNSMLNYLKMKFQNQKTIKKIIFIIISIIIEIYIYGMSIAFLLVCCNFEINLLTSIKLAIFFVLIYKYFISSQNIFSNTKISSKIDSILIVYCAINTSLVYFYQILCLEFLGIYEMIQKSENMILKNFSSLGFENYENKNLLIKLLPHFISNFLSKLIYHAFKFLSEQLKKSNIENDNEIDEEEIINKDDKNNNIIISDNEEPIIPNIIENKKNEENIIININKEENIIENEEKKENENDDNIDNNKIEKSENLEEQQITEEKINNEKEDFDPDNFQLDNINEARKTIIINKKEEPIKFDDIEEIKEKYKIKIMDIKNEIFNLNLLYCLCLLINFILKLFFPSLILVFCYIFTNYKLSVSLVIYFLIISINIILMFHYVLSNMKKFSGNSLSVKDKKDEKEEKMKILNKYEFISYKFILFFTLLFLYMSYLYSIIFGLKSKCKDEQYNIEKECKYLEKLDYSGKLIKSIAYLLGIYNYADNSEFLESNYLYIESFFLVLISKYIKLIISIIEKLELKNRNKYKKLYKEKIYLMDITSFSKKLELKKNQTAKNINIFEKMIKDYEDLDKIKFLNIQGNQDNEENLSEIIINSKKEKIITFLRVFNKIYKYFIIFCIMCCVVLKINIWSFIYIILIIILLFKRKNINKIYILFIVIISSISIQSLIFISNMKPNTLPKMDIEILIILKYTLSIPIFAKFLGEDYIKHGVLIGVGINRSELLLIWCENILIFLIYIYLYYFSYSLYNEKKFKPKKKNITSEKSLLNDIIMDLDDEDNFDKELQERSKTNSVKKELKDNPRINKYKFSKTLTPARSKIKEEDKPHHLSMIIGKKKEDIENNIIYQLLKDKYLKEYLSNITKEDYEKIAHIMKSNFNVEMSSYNDMNKILNIYDEQQKMKKLKKDNRKILEGTKNQKSNINIFYYILFLFSPNLFLIIILTILMLTPGLLSVIIIFFCLYFLYFCHLLSKGYTSFYSFIIKKVLRFIIIIDIAFSLIFQFILIYYNDFINQHLGFIAMIRFLGFREILNEKYEMTGRIAYLLGKCFCYFLMTLQKIIYSSKSFKIFYLSYIIKLKMHAFRLNSIINAIVFNNERINAMNLSIKIKHQTEKSMRELKNLIKELSKKLEKNSTMKQDLNLIKKEDSINNNNNNLIDDIKLIEKGSIKDSESDEKSDSYKDNDDIIKSKITDENKLFDEKMVKKIIKDWIFDQTFLLKIYSFLNKKAYCLRISSYMKENNMIINVLSGINEQTPKIEKLIYDKINKLHLSSFKENEINNLKKFLNLIDKMDRNKLEKFLSSLKSKKENDKEDKENEEMKKLLLNNNYKQIFNLKKGTLFNKYFLKWYLVKNILKDLITIILNKFYWICYLFMIINHMVNASIISIVYPLSIFCYALLQNPRPSKRYWRICYIYTFIIIVIKYLFQLETLGNIINFHSCFDKFSYEFPLGIEIFGNKNEYFKNLFIDFLVLIVLTINQNILWIKGLWEHDEIFYEDIEKAMRRISKYKNKTFKQENMKDLLKKVEENRITRKMTSNEKLQKRKTMTMVKDKEIGYFEKLFPILRNEKPGRDYYYLYTLSLIILIFYILIFYTTMVKDKTYGDVNISTNQFSGMTVILVLIHMIILIVDRVIYLKQNRYLVTYDYILYDKNEKFYSKGESKEKIKQIIGDFKEEDNQLLSLKNLNKINKDYNISIYQNETFNKPLLGKYILHILLTILSHLFIFFYITMYGNYNIYNATYCVKKNYNDECNNFQENASIIFFYLIYLFYLTFSALQIKYGFYDLKRTSIFKNVESFNGKIYEIYKLIPFYYQIKNIVDWTFTSTSFGIFDWFKFEYIYDEIFKTYRLKYGLEDKPVGQKNSILSQILEGGSISFLLIAILIGPLIIFSSLNPTSEINNVNSSDIKIYMSFIDKNKQERNILIFENNWAKSINTISDQDWNKYGYSQSYYTKTFPRQIQTISFYSEPENSLSSFKINHLLSSLDSLLNNENSDLKSSDERIIQCELKIEIDFMRSYPSDARTVKQQSNLNVCDYVANKNSSGCKGLEDLYNQFNYTNSNQTKDISFNISGFSHIVRLSASSEPKEVDLNQSSTLILQTKGNNSIEIYFEEVNGDHGIQYHVLNEKVSSGTFGYSVIGFYSAFILVIGTYVTAIFVYNPSSIMISEMPSPEKLLRLCEGIKISRYLHDFKNEEFYFNFLIEILRTPNWVKKLTKSNLKQFKKREELPA